MDKEYSNREIDHLIGDVKTQLDRIEKQTTTTNGKIADIQTWRERINGALILASFLGVSTFIAVVLMWLKLFR